MRPTFFKSGAEFRAWLEADHHAETELLIGFHKRASQKKGITYQEALDEALAFGWIDGVRRGLDADSYTIRFTPPRIDEAVQGRQEGLGVLSSPGPLVPAYVDVLGRERQASRDARASLGDSHSVFA